MYVLSTSRLFILMQEQKMFVLTFMLLSCSLFFSDASYVDSIPKCSIKDDQCIKDVFEKILRDIGSTGIAELNMSPIDPLQLTNISLTVLDAITLTITDGVIKGLKNCHFNKFSLDLDKQLCSQDIICDVLTIKGQFLFGGSSPMLQSVFASSSLSGHGKSKIKLEKVTMSLDIPVSVVKKADSNTYLKLTDEKPKYIYDIQQASFDIKNLVIGNNDISQVASSYLNSNWKSAIKTFGKVFIDKGLEFLLLFAMKFYDNVPTKVFFEEDLTPYIKN